MFARKHKENVLHIKTAIIGTWGQKFILTLANLHLANRIDLYGCLFLYKTSFTKMKVKLSKYFITSYDYNDDVFSR